MANTGNKRKRDSADHSGAPDAPPAPPPPEYSQSFESQYLQHTGEGEMTLAEALAQHNAGNDHSSHDDATNGQSVTDTASAALHYSMTVPPPTEETFLAQTTNEQDDRPSEPNFDIETATNEYTNISNDQPPDVQQETPSQPQPPAQITPAEDESPTSGSKPNVGSDEWHRVRRDNHKEVERRRRETINEGINELAKIVPGCEKNKGSILARAVQFISQLKDNENQNIEKWTLEKLLTEQAIAELSSTCDKLKNEVSHLRRDAEVWKTMGKRLGVEPTVADMEEVEARQAE